MLHKPHIRKGWYAMCSGVFAVSLLTSAWAYSATAVGPVVQGHVTKQDSSAVAGVRVEFHTPDGVFSVNTVTDASGAYSFSDTLTNGTIYVVEVSAPAGYNRNEPHQYNFTYATGDSVRTYDFGLTQAAKTISGTVTDTAGNIITDADINVTPYNIPSASSSAARTNGSGQYSTTVLGGTWFAQANVNLSEYTPRWIAEQPPVRIDFASDSTAESQTVNFVVTPATGKVTVRLLNSDGSKLTTSNFVADIHFSRSDGVGTARKVQQSDSSLSVYLTPGIYSISAFHSDLNGKSFDPDQTTFTMVENGVVDLGTVQAAVDTAHLKGKVTDGDGKALGGVQIEALVANGTKRPSAATAPDGTFDLTVGAGTWTVGIKNDNGSKQYSQVAPVTATVKNGETVSSLNFQVKTMDKTISGNVLDANGTKITGYVGTAFVQTMNKKFKVTAPVIDGSFTVQYSSFDIPGSAVYVGAEATDGSDYTGSSLSKVTISGASASRDLTVKPFNSALTGTLVLPNGSAVTSAGSDITIEGVDEAGNFTSTSLAADGTFNLPLAAGIWLFDYNITDPALTDGLLNRPAGQNTISIGAGQTKSTSLTVLKGTNTITGTVKDADGTAVQSATVNVDNRPALENSSSSAASAIVSATALTDANGQYSVKVPDGSYLVTVGTTPDIETNIMPDGKSAKVSGATTTTINLTFEKPNATITGKVVTDGKANGGGVINAYSDNGKEVSTTIASNGTYTLKLTSSDSWHVVATDLSGKKLLASEPKDLKPKAGSATVNLDLKDSGVSVPGPSSKTCAADDTCSVALPDGTSVTVPAFGVDLSGMIKLTVTPSVDLDQSMLDAPATLAYEVKALDSSGYEVKNLLKDAEVTIPYNQDEAAKNGLIESRLAPSFYDPNSGTWSDAGASGLIDTKNNVATIRTDHFTKFSVTGTVKSKPKVSSLKLIRSGGGTAVIEVRGKNFTSKVTAAVSKNKATKVTKKGDVLTITFSTKNLGSRNSLILTNATGRKVTVVNAVVLSRGTVSVKK